MMQPAAWRAVRMREREGGKEDGEHTAVYAEGDGEWKMGSGRREGTYLIVRARETRIVPVVDLALVADDGEEVVVVHGFGPEVPVPKWSIHSSR